MIFGPTSSKRYIPLDKLPNEYPILFTFHIFLFNKKTPMNQLTLTTPALLFSAISLLLLAYTNRFLAYANVVRTLHARFKESRSKAELGEASPDNMIIGQIQNLKKRLVLTRTMQLLGIGSLLLCVLCMFLVYIDLQLAAEIIFGIALAMLIISLAISMREIQISVKALDLHLGDMEL